MFCKFPFALGFLLLLTARVFAGASGGCGSVNSSGGTNSGGGPSGSLIGGYCGGMTSSVDLSNQNFPTSSGGSEAPAYTGPAPQVVDPLTLEEMLGDKSSIDNKLAEMGLTAKLPPELSEQIAQACRQDKSTCEEIKAKASNGANSWFDNGRPKLDPESIDGCGKPSKLSKEATDLVKYSDFMSDQKQKSLVNAELARLKANPDQRDYTVGCLKAIYQNKPKWTNNINKSINMLLAPLAVQEQAEEKASRAPASSQGSQR